jgi:hypothetical protein
MPVILNPLPDPFDLVIAGEQMRVAAMTMPMAHPSYMMPLLQGAQDAIPAGPAALIAGEQTYASMVGSYPVPPREILRSLYDGSSVAVNSCICSPTGALIFGHTGRQVLDTFAEASQMFSLTGITRDSSGAVLGSCEVWLFDPSGVHIDTTISDSVTGVYTFSYPSTGQSGGYLTAAWKTSDTLRGVTARNLQAA